MIGVRQMSVAGVLMMAAQSAVATEAINGAGATLFVDFFRAPASTNDWIDVNADGVRGFNPAGTPVLNQLAPSATFDPATGAVTFASGGTNTPQWAVQYRSVGSVNGFNQFVTSQLTGALPTTVAGERQMLNRTDIAVGGLISWGTSAGSNAVPGGSIPIPYATGMGNPAGAPIVKFDFANIDVVSSWVVQSGIQSNAAWNRKPAQSGYGLNPVVSSSGYVSNLLTLSRPVGGGVAALNTNTGAPDANTLYDTTVAWVPVDTIANRGTGMQNVKATELQQLYVTGRLPSGENLVVATRSVGSGTRNAYMNSLGIDTSWGMGENVGDEYATTTKANLGADFQASNGEGSSQTEQAVRNARLAVGFTGHAGASRAVQDSKGGQYEIVNVMNDHVGGTQYVRPTVDSILDNANPNTGTRIGGSATFVTRGDPLATASPSTAFAYPALGADGLTPAGPGNPANPAMENTAAALYLRNIVESIRSYAGNPGVLAENNMPGEFLANSFFLVASVDQISTAADPTAFLPTAGFNQVLQNDVRAAQKAAGNDPAAWGSAGSLTPIRNALGGGSTYSDGSTNGSYLNPDTGTFTITSAMKLNDRNILAGDFNNDGARNANDVVKLMEAATDPRAFSANLANAGTGSVGGTGMSADFVIPEIMGDFDGDGNFDARDVRYFADGLAIATGGPAAGRLDRKAGFVGVDNAWTVGTPGHPVGNYFNTVLDTGKVYATGDSRGDVAGGAAQAGAAPTGSDGIIDAKDIDYVLRQTKHAMGNGTDGSFATLLTRAITDPTVNVRADLSADINGDLKLDGGDAAELIREILATEFGDATLDRQVDAFDLNVLAAHWQEPAGATWAGGDFTGDGKVDAFDLNVLAANWQFGTAGGVSFDAALASYPVLAAVPEPASLAILGLGGMLMIRRRRK